MSIRKGGPQMKIVHYVANVCILLGAVSLIGGVIFKMFYIRWLNLMPISFINFSNICLLLGIALYVRELIPKNKE